MNDYSSPGPDMTEQSKVAFVLAGAGNQGALEVGVLLTLFEHNIRPDILVGTSVGAINAAAIAINPTLEGARWLEALWRGVTKEDIMPNSYLSMVWRLVRGHSSIFDNENLRAFLESQLPEGIRQFDDIKEVELYVTAVDLLTGELRVFGIDRTESLVDAVMASTALPPFLSPWQYQGREYVDGGVISDLPIRVALEMNAAETYAIGVYERQRVKKSLRGVFRVINQIVSIVSYQRLLDELGWCSTLAKGKIHYIGVEAFEGLRFWDFSHTEEMLEKGRQVGEKFLREHGIA